MITQAMSDDELAKLPTYEYMVEEISKLKNKVQELEKTLEEKDELIKKLKKRVLILEEK